METVRSSLEQELFEEFKVNFHEDMWILYKNKIPVEKVKVAMKPPEMNPLGSAYRKWWKIEKRRCIEGFWVSHLGDYKFVSGPLYFYVNFWRILLTPKNSKNKGKRIGIPFLRDLEWVRSFVYEEARGFSGFDDDEEYTCHSILKDIDPEKEPQEFEEALMEYGSPALIKRSIINSEGEFKKYVDPRKYLRKYFDRPLGKPLYFNMNNNVVDMESRGGGKSYWKSVLVGHNFLFDGALDYDDYLESKSGDDPLSSESLVGAIQSKYSDDLINKIKLGFENLPGSVTIGDTVYPSPFSRRTFGSWDSGKTLIAGYDKKVGGQWKKMGTFSKIQHRSFLDNHTAANGTRPSFSVIDEVGFMGNLLAALGQMKEAAADGAVKSGVIWMTGTGGDMDGGATHQVKAVFYSPSSYDCLGFKDDFENYQSDVGFFVPAFMTLNQFKDELGNTNWKLALKYLMKVRQKLRKNTKEKTAYDNEIVQRPVKHSEVFLINNQSILPVMDLKEHRDSLMPMQDDPGIAGLHGWMMIDVEGKAEFRLDPDTFKPNPFPMSPDADKQGAVVIWEEPDPEAEYGWYVAGNDPYDFDVAPDSVSLGSVIVIQRGTPFNGGFDRIVAEYTGRPQLASDFYEQVRRLLMYFGDAVCLYENEKQQIKEHFKKMYSIGLLAYTPGVLKANETSKTAKVRQYGQHMSVVVKRELEIYLRDWLLTPIGDGKLQLHTIKSIPLLDELISYNLDGNFDRVIALMLAVLQTIQMRTIIIEEKTENDKKDQFDDFFARKLF